MTGTPEMMSNDQEKEILRIFEIQKKHQHEVKRSSYKSRIKKLNALKRVVLDHRREIREALYNDLRKPKEEVDLTEIYTITSEIKHARRNLHDWTKPQSVSTPTALFGASSKIIYEPKGVALIISPWNFPLQLTFGPLISAIAAGNCSMVKPSEHTPKTSKLIEKLIKLVFNENEVKVFNGGIKTSTQLLKLPFDHIFFTGSSSVGKIVMAAAAKNLASVTLELGGKSPTIIDRSANLKKAAQRIVQGKFANNGQICIAPDYILIQKEKEEQFVKEIKERLNKTYMDVSNSSDYARIVNEHHAKRMYDLLEDAKAKGAKIVHGGFSDVPNKFIEPTIISNAPENAKIWKEEIFGPILPIKTYENIEEAIDIVNSKEKPLALYIYTQKDSVSKKIIEETSAGATCINSNAIHFYNNHLPFGGVNSSGIGKSHGWFGFESFSNARAVLKQEISGPLDLLMPPYTKWKQKLIDFTLRWL